MTNENNAATLKAAQGGVTDQTLREMCRAYETTAHGFADFTPNERGLQAMRAALEAALSAQQEGEIVVIKDAGGNIVAVTRQDSEGRILSTIATSAQQGQGYDVGWKIRGVTAYDEAKRKGYRHPECVEAAIKAAPPAQPAEVEATLRRILERGKHRTDGDLATLLDRVEHMTRGDQDLITMQRTEIRLLDERPAQLAERVPEGWNAALREARQRIHAMVLSNGWTTDSDAYAVSCLLEDMLTASPAPSEGGKGVDAVSRYVPAKTCQCLTIGQRKYCLDRHVCSMPETQCSTGAAR